MRGPIGAIALCAWLAGCSGGASLEGGPAPDDGSMPASAAYELASADVNDPMQSALEPQARPWIGTRRQRVASCGELAQSADEAFATDGFSRAASDAGEAFLVARDRVEPGTPEYIEFCVRVAELGSYRVVARVLAPDVDQDSFFVTVDEDVPGAIPEPGIYDASRSDDGFVDDVVGTRARDPLELALDPGEHLLRFYYRERNTALAGIRLEREGDAPGGGDGGGGGPVEALARCAANTGSSTDEIESLVERYLGSTPPAFALEGVPLSFFGPGDVESRVQRVNWFFDDGTTRANVLCLAPPPQRAFNLVANTVGEGRLVIGSTGPDRLRGVTPLAGGTFVGGGGDDVVETLESGRFVAGPGDDSVALISGEGGVFDGGPGADLLRTMEAGRFDGGAGDDLLLTQFAGTFDGGPGEDTVERQSGGATAVDVENVGIGFAALAPPSEPRFVDATTASATVRWTPSPDERTDGYVLTLGRADDAVDPNDLGAPPETVSPRVSVRPAYAIDRFDPFAPVVRIYAFERLDDGSTLYSEPASLTFEPGDGADFLVAGELIAERRIDARFLESTLAANGSVVVAPDPSAIGRAPDAPIFRVFDAALQDERAVDDAVADGDFDVYLGTARQYVVPRPRGGERATAIAFDGDASERLWERDVIVPIDDPSQEFQRCLFALVTRDDWLICSRVQGGTQAFDPAGDGFPLDDVDLLVQFSLIDGEDGRLVVVEDEDARSFEAFTRIDSAAAAETRVEVDLSARLVAGDAETELLGLVVVDDEVVLTGAILARRCGADCPRVEGERTGYFLARVALADGAVLAWRRVPLDERPGTGVGRPSPDGRSVVFDRENLLTRHDVPSLETLERRRVPGTVEGVGQTSVLVQERLFREDQPNLQTGSRFYLLTP